MPSLSGGTLCVGDLGGCFLWGGEKKQVYENGCKLNLMVLGGEQDIMLQLFSYTSFFSPPTGNIHQGHLHKRVPPERDDNYDKPEFGQPQEETLMSIVWN